MAINISKRDNLLVVRFDYSALRIGKIKQIRGHEWDRNNKVWHVPYTSHNLAALKELYKGEQVQVDFEDNGHNEKIIQALDKELVLKGYSSKTREVYIKQTKRFSSFIDCNIDEINNERLEDIYYF